MILECVDSQCSITLSLLPSETILAESEMSFYRHKLKYLGVTERVMEH